MRSNLAGLIVLKPGCQFGANCDVLERDIRARESSVELKLAIWGTTNELWYETEEEAAHVWDISPKPREVEDKV